MTIVAAPDLSKKSVVTDNVIIQQSDGNGTNSAKLLKLVNPQSASAIKMLSSNNGLASALRVPAVIQLTKTSPPSSTKTDGNSSLISSSSSNTLSDVSIDITDKQQSLVDYRSSTSLPPTPPPPVLDRTHSNIPRTNNQPTATTAATIKEISSINSKSKSSCFK